MRQPLSAHRPPGTLSTLRADLGGQGAPYCWGCSVVKEDVSRRQFLGTTGGVIGLAALGVVGQAVTAGSAEAGESEPGKEKRMKVGMLTNPFGDQPLEKVIEFASKAGIQCLEANAWPGSKHIDPAKIDAAEAEKIKALLADKKVEISSLCFYEDIADAKKGKAVQAHLIKVVDAASLLGVKTVCAVAGWPLDNMSKIDTIRKVLPGAFAPVIARAKEKGISIALENYFATNLQGLDTFEVLFGEAIKDDNFGLNYDPSHLVHQECDHLAPVSMFSKRIFHTHAKDCLVDKAKRARVGILADGWWRYVIPGFGNVNWGEYIGTLRQNGYNGVLSIEHEDGALSREDGFIIGARYLRQYC
jgi:sugar phosphate isomerase/epimerase